MSLNNMSVYACSGYEADDLLDDFSDFFKVELGEVADGPFGMGINKLNGNGFPLAHSQQMHKALTDGMNAQLYARVVVFFTREGNECYPSEIAMATEAVMSKLDRLRARNWPELNSVKQGPAWF